MQIVKYLIAKRYWVVDMTHLIQPTLQSMIILENDFPSGGISFIWRKIPCGIFRGFSSRISSWHPVTFSARLPEICQVIMLSYRKVQGFGAPAENIYREDLPNRPAPRLNVDIRRIPHWWQTIPSVSSPFALFRQNINILCWTDQI